MCQNPDGPNEHVPLDPGFDPGLCFMGRDCCTPRVYVALDAIVAALRQAESIDNGMDCFDGPADFIEREFGGANHA